MNLRINPFVTTDLKNIRDYIIIYLVGKDYIEIYRVLGRFQDITRALF